MSIRSRWSLLGLLASLLSYHALAAANAAPVAAPDTAPVTVPATAADNAADKAAVIAPEDSVREEFVAAMQRVRQHLPDQPDSPALQRYIIHDYLIAARLRRDLVANPGEDLDNKIEAFLHEHAGQPVSHAVRNEWLANLATRQRWDLFLSH